MEEGSESTGASKARKSKTPKNQPWFPPGSEQQAEEKSASKKKPKKRKKLPSTTSETGAAEEEKKTEPRKKKKRVLVAPPPKKKSSNKKAQPHQVFVEGFSDTSAERLKEYFQQFGDVAKAIVMTDHKTGKPRGFGFVTFESDAAKEKALSASHVIDKKPVRCLPSNNVKKSAEPPVEEISGWECFVGGLPRSVTAETLQNYFRRFGEVTDGRIMIDEHSKLPRGFGFVKFASKDNISSVIDSSHSIEGAVVTTKIAEPPKKKDSLLKFPTLPKGNMVFLGGLPREANEEQLRDLCGQFGKVQEVVIKVDPVTGKHRGFGFVAFEKRKALERCLEATAKGLMIMNEKKLTVNPARDKKSRDSHRPRGKKQETATETAEQESD